MLDASGLSLRVLNQISLQVNPGEVVAVLGANGAGKTTLLKLLSGEWKPVSGSVLLEGSPISEWSAGARARAMAVLPQTSQLTARFTGLEVAAMGRTPHANAAQERAIAMEALQAVDAAHLAARLYPQLSGGEQRRIHLARVLAQIWTPPETGFRYLLLDEPVANLDLAQQHRTLEIVRRFAADQVGVLAVMHDMNLASQYADRILLLKNGAAVALGSPAEVFTTDLIEDTFSYRVQILPHPRLAVPMIFPA